MSLGSNVLEVERPSNTPISIQRAVALCGFTGDRNGEELSRLELRPLFVVVATGLEPVASCV